MFSLNSYLTSLLNICLPFQSHFKIQICQFHIFHLHDQIEFVLLLESIQLHYIYSVERMLLHPILKRTASLQYVNYYWTQLQWSYSSVELSPKHSTAKSWKWLQLLHFQCTWKLRRILNKVWNITLQNEQFNQEYQRETEQKIKLCQENFI